MRVAVIGATGVVGETILRVLEERKVPVDVLLGYASRERDNAITFRGASLPVAKATTERIIADHPHVAFFASSDDASAEMANALAAAGIVVIDNSSTFRLDPKCPLIIPEVNPHAIRPEHQIFPVGNCTAIVLVVALAPIGRAVGLADVHVATYQAVSGAGRAGLDACNEEGGANRQDVCRADPAQRRPADRQLQRLGTGEESKVVAETRQDAQPARSADAAICVRVPVRTAHRKRCSWLGPKQDERRQLPVRLAAAPGVVYHEDGIITPLDVEGGPRRRAAARRESARGQRVHDVGVGDQLRKARDQRRADPRTVDRAGPLLGGRT